MPDKPTARSAFRPSRAMLLDQYRLYRRSGWIPDKATEAEYWQRACTDVGIAAQPNGGWEALGFELRLLSLYRGENVPVEAPGRSQLAKDSRKMASELRKIGPEITGLSHITDFFVAAIMSDNGDFGEHISELFSLATKLEAIAKQLDSAPQPPRWRDAARRRNRVILGIDLSPIFEQQFGESAVPIGGSEQRPLRDTNNWTRFFQAVACAFFDENATPDLQAILWEARRSVLAMSDTPPSP